MGGRIRFGKGWSLIRRYAAAGALIAGAVGLRLELYPVASGPALLTTLAAAAVETGLLLAAVALIVGTANAARIAVNETRSETRLLALTVDLERRVAERTEQLRGLAAELEATEIRERRQLARDLHDDIGQTIAAARVRLAPLCADPRPEIAATANAVGDLIDQVNLSCRSLASQLAPAVLAQFGLAPAIEWLAEEMDRNFGLKVDVVDDEQPKPLSQEARSILFRAVRELLINVAKHAQTEAAVIEVLREGQRIVIRVSDAGRGYDPAKLETAPRRGWGLISVRERLGYLGGTVEVFSTPGDGTITILSAPLSEEQPLSVAVNA